MQGGEGKTTAEAAAAMGATSLAAHNAIQHAQQPAPPLKRPRASAAAPLDLDRDRRLVKRERGAECQLDHARSSSLRINLGALRDVGNLKPEPAQLALAPPRPALAPPPQPHSLKADCLQLILPSGADADQGQAPGAGKRRRVSAVLRVKRSVSAVLRDGQAAHRLPPGHSPR